MCIPVYTPLLVVRAYDQRTNVTSSSYARGPLGLAGAASACDTDTHTKQTALDQPAELKSNRYNIKADVRKSRHWGRVLKLTKIDVRPRWLSG